MADRAHDARALTYDPAADAAARFPEWAVATADLGGLVLEALCWRRQVILIDASQRPEVQRSSLAHALAHLDLRHRWTLSGFFENREEAAADRLAARRLITVEGLADALSWSQDREAVACALGVDVAMLHAREGDLTKAERRRMRVRSRAAASSV